MFSVYIGRHLLCEINVSDRRDLLKLDDRAVKGTVKAAVARTHGDYGAALCSIRFCGKLSVDQCMEGSDYFLDLDRGLQ